nr:MAG TPA: hypothetical protein [Caudoviricetes sp.]
MRSNSICKHLSKDTYTNIYKKVQIIIDYLVLKY